MQNSSYMFLFQSVLDTSKLNLLQSGSQLLLPARTKHFGMPHPPLLGTSAFSRRKPVSEVPTQLLVLRLFWDNKLLLRKQGREKTKRGEASRVTELRS